MGRGLSLSPAHLTQSSHPSQVKASGGHTTVLPVTSQSSHSQSSMCLPTVQPKQTKSKLYTVSLARHNFSLLAKFNVPQRNPTPIVVENSLGLRISVLSPKGAQSHKAEKGPET